MKEQDDGTNVTHLDTKRQEKVDEKSNGLAVFQNWEIVGVKETRKKGKDGLEMITNSPVYLGKRPSDLLHEAVSIFPGFVNFNGVLTEVQTDPESKFLKTLPRNTEFEVESAFNDNNILVDFKKNVTNAVKWKPFTISLKNYVKVVSQVTKYPTWPLKQDRLVLVPGIEPYPTGALDRLLDFFCPETEIDRQLLKSLFCTPAWSEGEGRRPLFLIAGPIDADSNVSIGKTTLVDIMMKLYESGTMLHPEVAVDKLTQNLMNMQDQQIIMIDNVRSREWSSTALERLITSPTISGHKMYHGYASFPNHFTFVVTINDPQLNDDLASRAVVIRIKQPTAITAWRQNVETFLENSRGEVMRDIGHILTSPEVPETDFATTFRFPIWKSTILNKIQTNLGDHIKKQSDSLKVTTDHEEWVSIVFDKVNRYNFPTNTSSHTINTNQYRIFVATPILLEWYRGWLGIKIEGVGRGAEGKKFKKMCEEAGFKHSPQVKINTQPRAGYWINPETLAGPKVGIITQVKENPNAWTINSP